MIVMNLWSCEIIDLTGVLECFHSWISCLVYQLANLAKSGTLMLDSSVMEFLPPSSVLYLVSICFFGCFGLLHFIIFLVYYFI